MITTVLWKDVTIGEEVINCREKRLWEGSNLEGRAKNQAGDGEPGQGLGGELM
jgi:hypothetical protein